MTATTILKVAITAASALALAGGVLAQVQTGSPTSGAGPGMTPPPSTGVTTDTSRLATDCDRVAANARVNQPPHDAMGCNRTGTAMGAAGTAATTTSPGSTASSSATANAAPDAGTSSSAATNQRAQKVAKADRG